MGNPLLYQPSYLTAGVASQEVFCTTIEAFSFHFGELKAHRDVIRNNLIGFDFVECIVLHKTYVQKSQFNMHSIQKSFYQHQKTDCRKSEENSIFASIAQFLQDLNFFL